MNVLAWFGLGVGVAAFLFVWRKAARAVAWNWDSSVKGQKAYLMPGIIVGFLMTVSAPLWGPVYLVFAACEKVQLRQFMLDRVITNPYKELQ